MTKLNNIVLVFLLSSCASLTGPEGAFPDTRYDFLDEELSEDVVTTDDLELRGEEDHYPIDVAAQDTIFQEVPKPRQIFSAGGASEVQLRRLGELLWIYVETLPSTTWPITRSYWETSEFQLLDANPETGEMLIDFDEEINFKITIEHGIKESSSEIFLSGVQKDEGASVELDQDEIQPYLEDIVSYIADSVGTFSGTSLAAQSLNDRKKSRIFSENERTVIELDLNFERAWSTVSRAINASQIISNDRNRDEGIFYVSLSAQEESDESRFNPFSFLRRNPSEQIADPEYIILVSRSGSKTLIRAEAMTGNIQDAEDLLSILNESLS
jgi:outer membrane protein assembly factor BamC|tara:strand:- start:1077 stop:2057 length:981 start_codon:yes stop_codon:yes gene_type:complete